MYCRLEAGPEGLHVVAVHVGVRDAGHVHQAAAVEAQRRHVLEEGEGVDAVDRGHQGLGTQVCSQVMDLVQVRAPPTQPRFVVLRHCRQSVTGTNRAERCSQRSVAVGAVQRTPLLAPEGHNAHRDAGVPEELLRQPCGERHAQTEECTA